MIKELKTPDFENDKTDTNTVTIKTNAQKFMVMNMRYGVGVLCHVVNNKVLDIFIVDFRFRCIPSINSLYKNNHQHKIDLLNRIHDNGGFFSLMDTIKFNNSNIDIFGALIDPITCDNVKMDISGFDIYHLPNIYSSIYNEIATTRPDDGFNPVNTHYFDKYNITVVQARNDKESLYYCVDSEDNIEKLSIVDTYFSYIILHSDKLGVDIPMIINNYDVFQPHHNVYSIYNINKQMRHSFNGYQSEYIYDKANKLLHNHNSNEKYKLIGQEPNTESESIMLNRDTNTVSLITDDRNESTYYITDNVLYRNGFKFSKIDKMSENKYVKIITPEYVDSTILYFHKSDYVAILEHLIVGVFYISDLAILLTKDNNMLIIDETEIYTPNTCTSIEKDSTYIVTPNIIGDIQIYKTKASYIIKYSEKNYKTRTVLRDHTDQENDDDLIDGEYIHGFNIKDFTKL